MEGLVPTGQPEVDRESGIPVFYFALTGRYWIMDAGCWMLAKPGTV
ncbi:MAG: hypothetical protein JXL67_12655 [Calditrichaeota bacterium]|nr:hypothetical protein [Calditrichota bacterium]